MQGQRMRHSYEISRAAFCLVVLLSGTAFAQIASEGGRYLLRKSTTMPDGRVKVGALAVEPGKDGAEARVKTFVTDGNSFKEELITMSELAKWPSPIKGFQLGVSTDDELVLVDKDTAKGQAVGILQNARGRHDVPSRDLKLWLAGDVSIINAIRTADGRIRINEAPSTKLVAATSTKQLVDSVLTGPDGVDLALVQAAKQKADELQASLTPMFVDAEGRTRTWPPSSYSAHFMQDDMVYNSCSKLATLNDVKLAKGEVVQVRKLTDGGPLAWVKLPWRLTTGRSLWVSLVGDHGQEAKTEVQVYVLSHEEFLEYWAKREQKDIPKLTLRGTAPVLVQGLKPGRYVVGVQYTLDMNFVQQSVTDGISGPLDHVEDDLADASEIRGVEVKGGNGTPEIRFSAMRWYAVDVVSETVHPVVSLLIPKGASPSKRRSLYPSGKQFRIKASGELLEKLWQSLEMAGVKTTTEQREGLLSLLAKGGRVCVPGARSPTAIVLDRDGVPHVADRTRKQIKAESPPALP